MSKDIEVTTHHFKTHFSALIRDLEAGRYSRVIVKRNKQEIGVFSLFKHKHPERKLGMLSHLATKPFDMKAWKNADKEIEKDIYQGLEEDWADS